MNLRNGAVAEIRCQHQNGQRELKKIRHLWFKDHENLTAKQTTPREIRPSESQLKTAVAYWINRSFQELEDQPAAHTALDIKRWYY